MKAWMTWSLFSVFFGRGRIRNVRSSSQRVVIFFDPFYKLDRSRALLESWIEGKKKIVTRSMKKKFAIARIFLRCDEKLPDWGRNRGMRLQMLIGIPDREKRLLSLFGYIFIGRRGGRKITTHHNQVMVSDGIFMHNNPDTCEPNSQWNISSLEEEKRAPTRKWLLKAGYSCAIKTVMDKNESIAFWKGERKGSLRTRTLYGYETITEDDVSDIGEQSKENRT